ALRGARARGRGRTRAGPDRPDGRDRLELVGRVRADAGDGELLADTGGDLTDLLEGDRVERRDRLVGVGALAEHDPLAGRVAGDRAGVLEREDQPSGGVRAGADHLLLGRPLGPQLVDDLAHASVRLDALGRLQAG